MTATHCVVHATNYSNSAPFVELQQSLSSRVTAISPFVERLMRFIRFFMGKAGMARATEEELENRHTRGFGQRGDSRQSPES